MSRSVLRFNIRSAISEILPEAAAAAVTAESDKGNYYRDIFPSEATFWKCCCFCLSRPEQPETDRERSHELQDGRLFKGTSEMCPTMTAEFGPFEGRHPAPGA